MKIHHHLLLFALLSGLSAQAQPIQYEMDPATGGITSLRIPEDPSGMSWTLAPDGSQYPWIGREYAWGLGRMLLNGEPVVWMEATSTTRRGRRSVAEYQIGRELVLRVERRTRGAFLEETYTFRNRSDRPLSLTQVEINTPFNDNYPDSRTCLEQRCHAHIWPGGRSAWVCALRMGATAPHLGLVLRHGSVNRYAVRERSREKGMSNTRGVLCLVPDDTLLQPGRSLRLRWRIFAHRGWEDFFHILRQQGCTLAEADRYVAEVGDTVTVRIGRKTIRQRIDVPGETVVRRQGTRVELLGISRIDSLIARRARFILDRQQVRDPESPLNGAFLPYDNGEEKRYFNWEAPEYRNDMTEGRERVGMGIFLAEYARIYGHPEIIPNLEAYAHFIRTRLQEEDYKTWGEYKHDGWHRLYNYPWITRFYVEMFKLTGEGHYLQDAYGTQMAAYRYGGHGFYSIDVPVRESLSLLRANGMEAEAETLLGEYRLVADSYLSTGLDYPASEVNYEQSIVAPSICFLSELFLVTGDSRYRDAVQAWMPVLEAFNGRQPSSHLHDIAIRHWDAYWFGKERRWGDTFPHYWSCITADAFNTWAECTGDESYRERARAICRQNLSLFSEDGRGWCAYVYPDFIEGEAVHRPDTMANDQDWALAFLLRLR